MRDLTEVARELAEDACRELWGFAVEPKSSVFAKRFEPILAKHFALQPVDADIGWPEKERIKGPPITKVTYSERPPIVIEDDAPPQPVAMEAVVRRIAAQMTDLGEHYSPEDEEWQEVFEVNAGLIRAELAPVETLLRECSKALHGLVISYEVVVESIDLDGPAPLCAVEASFDVGTELDEIVRAERLISQIDTIIGGQHGTGQ